MSHLAGFEWLRLALQTIISLSSLVNEILISFPCWSDWKTPVQINCLTHHHNNFFELATIYKNITFIFKKEVGYCEKVTKI